MPAATARPRIRRIAAAVAVSLSILLTLAACDKPAPSVTVFSGSISSNVEALCWSFDAQQKLDVGRCLGQGSGQSAAELAASLTAKVGVVPVSADQTIGISVDPQVADAGWYPVIGDSRLTAQPVTTTYYRFQLSAAELRGGSVQLRVLALGGDGTQVRGLWLFELRPPTGAGGGTGTTPQQTRSSSPPSS